MSTLAEDLAIGTSLRPRLHHGLAVGGTMLVLLVVVALVGPRLSPYDPNAHDFEQLLQPPSVAHPFGTDNFGRDVLTRVLSGAVIDLRIGVLAAVFPFVFGSLLGAAAGYHGGWVDTLLMRTVDVFTAVPFFVLVTAIVAFLGPGELNVFVAIGAAEWVTYSGSCAARFSGSGASTTWPPVAPWGSPGRGSCWATSFPTLCRRRSSTSPRMSS
jgi:peptide/nickel transport system permease protein